MKLVHVAEIIDLRYKRVREQTKASLEKATWAASLRSVGRDFRAAL
jgi:hypothetical protein